jgi:hypothetical protein
MSSASPETPSATGPPAWPFLVSRGVGLGFRVIVAPDFLAASGDRGLVYESADSGPGGDPAAVRTIVVRTTAGKPVTLIFRQQPALARYAWAKDENDGNGSHGGGAGAAGSAGPDGSALLRDQAGRSIPMVEGFALPGEYADGLSITAQDWARAHRVVVEAYRTFLRREADGPVVATSGSLRLAGPSAGTPSREVLVGKAEPTGHRGKLLVGGVAVAVLAVVLAVVLPGIGGGGGGAARPGCSASASTSASTAASRPASSRVFVSGSASASAPASPSSRPDNTPSEHVHTSCAT